MKFHDITKEDMSNGDGMRVVLWVSGCGHHCPECQNPITWNPEVGVPFDDAAKNEIFEQLDKSYISGITFSGGDPLYPGNRREVLALMKEIKELYPDKNIWGYTGYTWEQLFDDAHFSKAEREELLSLCDVMVEGRYEKDLRDIKLHWRGSSNQRVVDVKATMEKDNPLVPELHCHDYVPPEKIVADDSMDEHEY